MDRNSFSVALADWAEQHGVMLEFIKTRQNRCRMVFIERFNRSYREAVLDMFVFQKLERGQRADRKVAAGVQTKNDHTSLWAT